MSTATARVKHFELWEEPQTVKNSRAFAMLFASAQDWVLAQLSAAFLVQPVGHVVAPAEYFAV